MSFEYTSAIRQFMGSIADPHERQRRFSPLTLKPVDIAALLDKLEGLYDPPSGKMLPTDTVVIGSKVLGLDMLDFTHINLEITLPEDSDPRMGKISVLSPLGSALLGIRIGETVTVYVGNSLCRYRVIGISSVK